MLNYNKRAFWSHSQSKYQLDDRTYEEETKVNNNNYYYISHKHTHTHYNKC